MAEGGRYWHLFQNCGQVAGASQSLFSPLLCIIQTPLIRKDHLNNTAKLNKIIISAINAGCQTIK